MTKGREEGMKEGRMGIKGKKERKRRNETKRERSRCKDIDVNGKEGNNEKKKGGRG